MYDMENRSFLYLYIAKLRYLCYDGEKNPIR